MLAALSGRRKGGLQEILKNHAGIYTRLSCGFDEGVGALGAYIHGLFCQHVQAAPGCGDAVSGVQAGRASDNHELPGGGGKESVEVLIWLSAVFAAKVGAAY